VTISDNGLVDRYGLLEPDERFRLALQAAARGDERERRRLVDTCPMRTITTSDPAYLDQIGLSRDLAVTAALELGPLHAQLRMLEVACELAAVALGCGEPVSPDDSGLVAGLTAGAGELRARGAAVLEAFATVCRKRLKLDAEVVLRAHLGPHVDRLDLDEFRRAKPDRAAVRRWREVFETPWRR
jgi:hypothetical protein